MLYFKITIYGQIKLPVLAKIFIAIRPQTFPLFGHCILTTCILLRQPFQSFDITDAEAAETGETEQLHT